VLDATGLCAGDPGQIIDIPLGWNNVSNKLDS
jgi:hypothetical protein